MEMGLKGKREFSMIKNVEIAFLLVSVSHTGNLRK
jgi:hypothetical protein